jgi:hypothetical protein
MTFVVVVEASSSRRDGRYTWIMNQCAASARGAAREKERKEDVAEALFPNEEQKTS